MQSLRRLYRVHHSGAVPRFTRSCTTKGGNGDDGKQDDAETKTTTDERSRASLEALRKIFGSSADSKQASSSSSNSSSDDGGATGIDLPQEWAKYVVDDRSPHEKPGGGDILDTRSMSPSGIKQHLPARFKSFKEGDIYQPDDLNWMQESKFLEHDTNERMNPTKGQDAVYFRQTDQDRLELALNPDLLRLFLSPTGRIQPRRFTGLTAKEQRKLQRAIKLSRQLGLLPYCSKYPEPSHDQLLLLADEVSAGFDYRDFEKLDDDLLQHDDETNVN